MKITPTALLSSAALGLTLITPHGTAAVFSPTTGTYDENTTNANTVDVNVAGATVFGAAVLAAFNADLGGVIDFDTSDTVGSQGTEHSATYGNAASKTFNFTTSISGGLAGTGGSFFGISGGNGFIQLVDATSQLYTFNQDDDGAVAGAPLVSQIGFTLLPRNNAAYPLDVLATAMFTDGSTQAVTSNLGNVVELTDTFLSFTAPVGEGVASLNLQSFQTGTTTPVSTRIGIDDLGFITAVPEPGSMALLLAGGTLMLARKRNA